MQLGMMIVVMMFSVVIMMCMWYWGRDLYFGRVYSARRLSKDPQDGDEA